MSKKTKKTKQPPEKPVEPTHQRLQRVMAAAGVGSRRECETIIEEGRVEVDGQTIVELGVKVDPDQQEIFVDGERLQPERLQYFMLNKPSGIVSTSRDPSGRTRVIDLIKTDSRVYNVGRLDQSSEGLILVTNDGELANRLTHPRYGVEKKYHVQVAGIPSPATLKQLEKGVYLAEGKAKATRVRFLRKVKNSSWIEIVLAEGRNREIRRMLATIGHKVRVLKRVAIGPLRMGDLPVGAHRPLTPYELKALKRAAAGEQAPKRKKKSSRKTKTTSAKSAAQASAGARKHPAGKGKVAAQKAPFMKGGVKKTKPGKKIARPNSTGGRRSTSRGKSAAQASAGARKRPAGKGKVAAQKAPFMKGGVKKTKPGKKKARPNSTGGRRSTSRTSSPAKSSSRSASNRPQGSNPSASARKHSRRKKKS